MLLILGIISPIWQLAEPDGLAIAIPLHLEGMGYRKTDLMQLKATLFHLAILKKLKSDKAI